MKNGKNKKKTKPKTKKARSPRRPQKSPANVSGYQTKADQGQESMGILPRRATRTRHARKLQMRCTLQYIYSTLQYDKAR